MRRLLPCLAGVLLLTAGCGKIEFDQPVTMAKDQHLTQVEFKGLRADGKVKVVMKSESSPVGVYLTLVDNLGLVVGSLDRGMPPEHALAKAENTREAKLEAEVPAGKPFVVLLRREKADEEIKVQLNVTGE